MKDEILNAYDAWNEAFNRGDPGRVASFYMENARLLPPTTLLN
jgi:ketosteroid isomerase-like protein